MSGARDKASKSAGLDLVTDLYAARLHNDWRREFHRTNPGQRRLPRIRKRGGALVDVNQPWSKLDSKAKADNKLAARAAYEAIARFPNDREAAADYVHKRWIARNKGDASQPKALFKPYQRLSEIEKDKDRAHVDAMKKALAAVAKRPAKKAPRKAAKKAPVKSVKIDAQSWKRLEAAAKQLSAALGRDVPVEALVTAGVEAMARLAKAMAAEARTKRR